MQTEVMEKCDLLVQNRNLIYRGFMLEDSLMQVIAATAFVDRDETTEVKAIKECRKLLRKKHSAFSYLRGNNELFISSKSILIMSLKFMKNFKEVNSLVRYSGFYPL